MGTAEVQVEPWGHVPETGQPLIRPAYGAVFDEAGVENGAKLLDETNTIL